MTYEDEQHLRDIVGDDAFDQHYGRPMRGLAVGVPVSVLLWLLIGVAWLG